MRAKRLSVIGLPPRRPLGGGKRGVRAGGEEVIGGGASLEGVFEAAEGGAAQVCSPFNSFGHRLPVQSKLVRSDQSKLMRRSFSQDSAAQYRRRQRRPPAARRPLYAMFA